MWFLFNDLTIEIDRRFIHIIKKSRYFLFKLEAINSVLQKMQNAYFIKSW